MLRGAVHEPDGRPAVGALVTTSAGGRATTGPRGYYRMEVRLPDGASSVQVTAVGRGAPQRVASVRAVASASAGVVPVPLQTLASGGACESAWLPTFGEDPGTDREVTAMAVFDDGTGPALFVGGAFTSAGGVEASHIARWDGERWSSLGEGTSGVVRTLLVHDDGSGPALIVGGSFTRAGGVLVRRVARWDGTSWSALGPGLAGGGSAYVSSLALHDDGNGPALFAGGSFLNSGAVSLRNVARWDGSAWSPVGSGVFGGVLALASYDDGSGPALHVGGFLQFAGRDERIVRWNGSTWSPVDTRMDGTVATLAVFDDGGGPDLYAGGSFTTAGGVPVNHVARWDGLTWEALADGLGGRPSDFVGMLAVYDDGSGPALHAGGRFRDSPGPVRWDGMAWTPLGTGVDGGSLAPIVQAACVFEVDGEARLHVGGSFVAAGDVAALSVANWDGADWRSVSSRPGLDSYVVALEVFDDGSGPALHVAGDFTRSGSTVLGGLARWEGRSSRTGEPVWSPLGTPPDGPVVVLTAYDDGTGPSLFAGGLFSEVGGVPTANVARWDGTRWWPLDLGIDGFVQVLEAHDDGSGLALYAGGSFERLPGGTSLRRLARWDGATWAEVGGGTNDDVLALTVHRSFAGVPELVVAGWFTQAGTTSVGRIARWTGTDWRRLGGGLDGPVFALESHDDGSGSVLYAGGAFTTAGGVPAFRVARWDGTSWSALDAGVGASIGDHVHNLLVHEDAGRPFLFAGGHFETASGVAARGLARWDGVSWSPLSAGRFGTSALATWDDGTGPALLVGGRFFSLESGDGSLARFGRDTTPPELECPTSVTAYERPGSAPGEVVHFSARALDGVDPAPIVTFSPASGSVFPLGTTMVTAKAVDACGNVETCLFPVTVREKRAEVGF